MVLILPANMPHRLATLAVLLGLVLLPSRLTAADQASAKTVPESSLTQGTLPNGLRYVILPHDSPKGDIGLRLIVQAGSLDEHDDERGFAHFVEHMAFNGTRNFPPGTARLFLETLGLQFGADINANTSYTHTQYLLDLPAGRADHLEETLILLRDYADGQLFLPNEVKEEAKVVISEQNARNTAEQRTAFARRKILYEGTLVVEREVGGLAEQIERATAEQLRAFYRRNYSPGRMTLLIVGPVDPASLMPKITQIFGAIAAGADNTAAYAAPETPRAAGIKPAVLVVPTFTTSVITEFNFVSSRPPDTVYGRRQALRQRIAVNVLERRLEAKREPDVTQYSRPHLSFSVSESSPAMGRHAIEIGTLAGSWSDAVKFLETELRRGREGFAQAEIDEAVAGELKSLQNRIPAELGQSAAELTGALAGQIMTGREWQSPAVRYAEAKAAWAGLTPAEVAVAFTQIFPPDSFRLILAVPPDHQIKPERLLAAYEKSTGRTLKVKATAGEDLHFRYDNFGPAGKITGRERVEDLDISLVSFENGVRLNVRPSPFEPEQFRLRIVFPQNLSNVPADLPGMADLAGQLLLNSSMRKHKQTELSRLLRLHDIKPGFSVNTGTPSLTLSGPADELTFALQYLTALLSDLEFDDEYYRVALSYYAGMHKNTMNSAGGLGMREALRIFAGNDQRALLIHPRAFASEGNLVETQQWLKNHILSGPLEVGLVGDFSADEAITAAAATIGTLKVRKAPPKSGAPLALPKKASRQESLAEITASTAFSCVLWPVESPDDPKHNAALAFASAALQDHLMLIIREAMGATYAPQTRIHRDIIQRDFAFVGMINTFDPASARKFTEAGVRLAALLAEKGLSAAEFERLREPLRARYAEDMRNNNWWLNEVVSLAQSRPDGLGEARRHEKIYDEITLEDVNHAAQVFKSDKVTIVIVQPKPAVKPAHNGPKKK